MVAIDTYFYVGDEQITGGEIGVKPVVDLSFSLTGNLAGLATMIAEYQRVVPSNEGGILDAAYFPYYDGTYVFNYSASAGGASTVSVATATFKPGYFVGRTVTIASGTGAGQSRTVSANTSVQVTVSVPWGVVPDATSRFNFGPGYIVAFHYIPNQLIPGTGGDNWFQVPIPGSITPMGMLMQRLHRLYGNVAPGFRMLKSGFTGGVGSWKTGTANWDTVFLGRYREMQALEEGRGNTLVPKAFIIDAAVTDIFNTNVGFQADLDAMLNTVRAEMGPQCQIIIVMPHQLTRSTTTPPFATALRGAIQTTVNTRRQAGEKVSYYDMNWGTHTWNLGQPNTVQSPDPRYFDLPTVIQTGIGLFNTIQASLAPTITAPLGRALPAVVMLGDSQLHGLAVNPLLALYANQPSLVGPNILNSVKNNVWIWDDAMQQLVAYDVMANSNTYGGLGGMGPDVSLPRKLIAERYPQGCVLFKFAKGGVSLTAEAFSAGPTTGFLQVGGTLWEDIKMKWAKCRVSTLQTLGRNLDTIGILISLGENDCGAGGTVGVTAFEAQIEGWLDEVRDVFTTRVDGVTGIVYMQGPPPATEVAGGSVLGTAENRNRYRTKVAALATAKQKLRVILNTGPFGVNGYELSRDDIHYGGETMLRIGDKAAALMLEILAEDAAGEGAGAGGGTEGTDGAPRDDAGTDGGTEGVAAAAPDLGTSTGIIDALDEAILQGGDVAAYTVNGRTTQMRSLTELIAARKYFVAEASKARGLRRTRVRFRS